MAADIVAEMRMLFNRSWHDIDRERARDFPNRLEAALKRAYKKIDSAVCGIDSATASDIDDVRKAMDETIGDYYE